VLQGTIGVGLLDVSQNWFVDSVDEVTTDTAGDITFLIEDIREVCALVVRNAGAQPVSFEWLGADSTRLIYPGDFDDRDVQKLEPVSEWHRYYALEARNTAEWIRQFQFDRLRESRVMRWRDGLRLVITPGEEVSRAVFVSGVYEPASTAVLRRLILRGTTFIDVGANIGIYTLLASRWVGDTGHVYSFEPSSRELAVLRRNVELNRLTNVTVIQAAVHDHAGSATLHVAGGKHRGQNTLAPSFAYEIVEQEDEEQVSLVVLDELWKTGQVPRPDVIKIDAEGAELHILRGAAELLRETGPAVLFEANERLLRASGASIEELARFICNLNYSVYRLDDDTGDLIPVSHMRNVSAGNFVAFPRRYSQALDRT
jgi:FkbM family methyltransferase